jgi:hypothetical protein
MNRFSIQNVKDREVNSVLMQIQDALNKLSDVHTSVTEPTAKIVTRLQLSMAARKSFTETASGDTPALRMVIPASSWTHISFPGTYTIIPNYTIDCWAVGDYNRRVVYKLQSLDETGYEIWVKEQCRMMLEVFPITTELYAEAH